MDERRRERGDPGCTIGAVFETAAIVGVRLFDAGPGVLGQALGTNAAMLALLPKSVRPSAREAEDDF